MKSLVLSCSIAFACGVGTALFVSATPTRTAPRPVVITSPVQVALSQSSPKPSLETGLASYYADAYQGKPTASGGVFDMHQLTAAHRNLPFGTIVKVTQMKNQQSVLVRVNDRGPFVDGRVIDLSLSAAQELQMVRSGFASVELEVVR